MDVEGERLSRLPKRVWAVGLCLATVIPVYLLPVTVTDLPPSPARTSLAPIARHVVHPWFDQQWTLFAPTPPMSNSRLYLEVRYRPGAGIADPPTVEVSKL